MTQLGAGCALAILALVAGMIFLGTLGASAGTTVSKSVTVTGAGSSTPSVSTVVLNAGSAITLTANATTAINVSFTVSDNDGCSDVFTNGNVTTSVFRSGVGSSSAASNLNMYRASTSTHNCTVATTTSANATATVYIYYFAEATDASSSYPSQYWEASVVARDATSSTGSASSTGVELNTLLAINVTTSSINYGNVTAGTDTGGTNQTATTTNAGNASTSLRLHASATLTSGSNSISTSSQRYSTSSFTYPGTSTALTDTAATVSGVLLTSPTSTTNVERVTFWGLSVAAGTATGTYTGTTVFSALFQP